MEPRVEVMAIEQPGQRVDGCGVGQSARFGAMPSRLDGECRRNAEDPHRACIVLSERRAVALVGGRQHADGLAAGQHRYSDKRLRAVSALFECRTLNLSGILDQYRSAAKVDVTHYPGARLNANVFNALRGIAAGCDDR